MNRRTAKAPRCLCGDEKWEHRQGRKSCLKCGCPEYSPVDAEPARVDLDELVPVKQPDAVPEPFEPEPPQDEPVVDEPPFEARELARAQLALDSIRAVLGDSLAPDDTLSGAVKQAFADRDDAIERAGDLRRLLAETVAEKAEAAERASRAEERHDAACVAASYGPGGTDLADVVARIVKERDAAEANERKLAAELLDRPAPEASRIDAMLTEADQSTIRHVQDAAGRVRQTVADLGEALKLCAEEIELQTTIAALEDQLARARGALFKLTEGPLPAPEPDRDALPSPRELRSWAWQHGYECPTSGKVPGSIIQAWRRANVPAPTQPSEED